MQAETPAPRRSARPDQPGGEPAGAPRDSAEPERFGPLALERHRKDDGRALLLYEWWGETPASAPGGGR